MKEYYFFVLKLQSGESCDFTIYDIEKDAENISIMMTISYGIFAPGYQLFIQHMKILLKNELDPESLTIAWK